MAVAAGTPGSLIALGILWTGDYSAKVQWTFGVFILALWWGFAFATRERTVTPLQTLANLLEALREGDYSIRARHPSPDDALGEVMLEVNQLGDLLRRGALRRGRCDGAVGEGDRRDRRGDLHLRRKAGPASGQPRR